jgi:peptidoglycan-N-acetylglucosamine deacetylase
MSNDWTHKQPWQWSLSEITESILNIRAGRSLRPKSWPNGAKCAVAFSFDVDHESNELRDGAKSVTRLSWGQYGARVGLPKVRQVLRNAEVQATFFIPAVIAQLYENDTKTLVYEGHEIGLHGWIHELASDLPHEVEKDLLSRGADLLEKICGTRPRGARMPSMEMSRQTVSLLRDLDFVYDSSMMADLDCYEIDVNGRPSGLLEIPIDWSRDDGAYLMMDRFGGVRPYTSPEDVLEIFSRELDGAFEEGGLFQIVMHPHIIGYRSRIWILEELIRRAKAKSDVWFCTHRQLAEWVAVEPLS